MAEDPAHPFDGIATFPVLTTERLLLRDVTVEDFPWYVAHFSRPEVAEGQGCAPPPDEEAAQADFERRILEPFAAKDGIRWGLVLREDPSPLIGSAGVFYIDAKVRSCEFGYDLDPAYWGRGLMIEACRAILDFVFTQMGMNRVAALLMPRNLRSRAVVERLGFTQEGVMREHGVDERGELVDDVLFSLLRREWRGA